MFTGSLALLGAASAGMTLTAQVATVIVGFLIVFFVLKSLAWNGVLKALDERRETVRKQFEDIDRKQAELASMIKDYEERLRRIDDEARERLNKAVDEGRKIATDLVEKARQEADANTQRSLQAIRIEADKARIELRNDMVKIAIGAAEKLMQAELNGDRQRQLVGAFVAEMEQK